MNNCDLQTHSIDEVYKEFIAPFSEEEIKARD